MFRYFSREKGLTTYFRIAPCANCRTKDLVSCRVTREFAAGKDAELLESDLRFFCLDCTIANELQRARAGIVDELEVNRS